jgi:hypothetical protein
LSTQHADEGKLVNGELLICITNYTHTFVRCLFTLLQLADCNTVIDGFNCAGVLDSESKAWPDLDVMIHSCQGTKTLQDQATVFNTFKEVHIRTVKQGHITDEYFDELGYPKDIDANGKDVKD